VIGRESEWIWPRLLFVAFVFLISDINRATTPIPTLRQL
jgi:hypothetical protein